MAGFALRRLGETVARRTTAMKQVVQRRAVNSARPAQRDFSKGAEKQTGIWARYQDILRHGGAPAVAVKSLTASIMLAGGDIACQTLMEGKSVSGVGAASLTNAAKTHENSQGDDAAPADPHGAGSVDLERVARFTSLGAFLVAPTLHIWYNFLGARFSAGGLTATAKKLACDQFLFAPTFIGVFFAALNALEGKGVEELRERLRNDWGETVVSNWMLWIPAQAVNLGLVPLHLQVLFGNVVSLAWNSYLSWVSHRHLRDSPAAIGDA